MKQTQLLLISMLLSAPLFGAENTNRELVRLTAIRATREESLIKAQQEVQALKETLKERRNACKKKDKEIQDHQETIQEETANIKYYENLLRTARRKVAATEKVLQKSKIASKSLSEEKRATKEEVREAKKVELGAIEEVNKIRKQRNAAKNIGIFSYVTGSNSDNPLEEVVSDLEDSDTEENVKNPEKKAFSRQIKATNNEAIPALAKGTRSDTEEEGIHSEDENDLEEIEALPVPKRSYARALDDKLK